MHPDQKVAIEEGKAAKKLARQEQNANPKWVDNDRDESDSKNEADSNGQIGQQHNLKAGSNKRNSDLENTDHEKKRLKRD